MSPVLEVGWLQVCGYDVSMHLFVVKAGFDSERGNQYEYFHLREHYLDRQTKKMAVRFVAYLGRDKTVSRSKARSICEAKGLTMAELRSIEGLRIAPDGETLRRGAR